jgi:sugar lactone lactonase YvrE
MKNKFHGFLGFSVILLAASALAATDQAPVWTVSENMAQPESVYFDGMSNSVFVSNVAGNPGEKDGNGWISRLNLKGETVTAKWVTGLNAPKGMRSYRGVLWVADIDQIVSIDIASAKILKRFPVKGAKFLNDVAIDQQGRVYVSDTMANRIHVVRDAKVSVFSEGPQLEAPNGLLYFNERLYVAAWGTEMKPDFSTKAPGHLYFLDLKTKKKTEVSKVALGHLDGLEMDMNQGFYVSDWMAGKVFHVTAEGKSQEILTGVKNAADLAYVSGQKLLIVPSMGDSRVKAFKF